MRPVLRLGKAFTSVNIRWQWCYNDSRELPHHYKLLREGIALKRFLLFLFITILAPT
jgi:hypothetical protein